jgi:hypothetical protein
MPTRVEAVASDRRLGADSVEADRAKPRPDATVGGLCLDFVMRGSSTSMPGHTAQGDADPAPGFLGVMDPRVAGPRLSGSPGLLPLPINKGHVKDSLE